MHVRDRHFCGGGGLFPVEVPAATVPAIVIPGDPTQPVRTVAIPTSAAELEAALRELIGAGELRVVQSSDPALVAPVWGVCAVSSVVAPPGPAATSGEPGTAAPPPVPDRAAASAGGAGNVRAAAVLGTSASHGTADLQGDVVVVVGLPPLWHRAHRLHPVAVEAFGKPLYADACSALPASLPPDVAAGMAHHASEVAEASRALRETVIPTLAAQLEERFARECAPPATTSSTKGKGDPKADGKGDPKAQASAVTSEDPKSGSAEGSASPAGAGAGAGAGESPFRPASTMIALEMLRDVMRTMSAQGLYVRHMGLLRSHMTSKPLRDAVRVCTALTIGVRRPWLC